MNELYFTPKLEELRIGIECEIPITTPDNYVKHTLSTPEDLTRISSSYQNIRIRVPYLTNEQIVKEGWFQKGNIFYKTLWNITMNPNHRIIIKFGDEKRFQGKCKDINTLRFISNLLEID
jgi:hypothetical protein